MVEPSIPSKTALSVALRRAAHQLYDTPTVFNDPIAVPILGAAFLERLERTPRRLDRPFSVAIRAYLVARSLYAEDNLRLAVGRGVRQYVLVGAGLDTFAYRNPYAGLRVFEVDHPATQEWKRELLQRNSIAIPGSVVYTPVDLQRQQLSEHLRGRGFNPREPAFFSCLGVAPYLSRDAFRVALGLIAACPPGSGVTLDYGQPRSALPPMEQLAHDSLASRVEKVGEPFRLFFTPAEIAVELSRFHTVEDLGCAEVNERYFSGRTDQLAMRGEALRLLSAWL